MEQKRCKILKKIKKVRNISTIIEEVSSFVELKEQLFYQHKTSQQVSTNLETWEHGGLCLQTGQ